MKKALKRVTIGIVGFPLIILGIILIPLPGPGLLISFAGLLVLSSEFEWAHQRKVLVLKELQKIIIKARQRSDRIVNIQK